MALCIIVAALFIGATLDVIRSGQRHPTLTEDVTLRIGLLEPVDSLNPYIGLNLASYFFYGLVYDSLFSVDNALEPAPNLALDAYMLPESDPSMVASGEPYGSVWQYNLTHNASWHDGTPFTADDVVWNIWLSADVTHYNTMWAYQPYSYFIKSAEKVDNYTVKIHFWDRQSGMSIPVSWGRSIPIPMLPRHLMEDFTYSYVGMDWTGVFNNTQSPGLPMVGTGPFMVTDSIYADWVAGDHITLVRNPDYHSKLDSQKEVHFDRLLLRFYGDSTSIMLSMMNGEIDVASLPPNAYESVKDDIVSGNPRGRMLVATSGPDPAGMSTQLMFNMRNSSPNPARLDVVIRQAIHMAINKSFIVNDVYLGFAEAGTTMISSGNSWHYTPSLSERFSYDIAAANATLEANGYLDIDSNGIRECTIQSPAVSNGYVEEGRELRFTLGYFLREYGHHDAAEHIRSQLQTIGIGVNISAIDDWTITYGWSPFYGVDAMLETWWWDVDPNFALFQGTEEAWNSWSFNNYYNASFDENFNLSVRELNPEVRQGYVDSCQRIAYNDSASIFLAYHNTTYVHRNDTFSGWGIWEDDPGRSLNAIWGANPLFFDLTPISNIEYVDVYHDSAVFVVVGAIVAVVAVVVGMVIFIRGRPPGSKSQEP